jgi:hypothetical protein
MRGNRGNVARATRWPVTGRGGDRGDSPVPTAIIIAGLALIAIGLLVWLGSYVTSLLDQAPTQLPGGPAGGG